MKSTLDQLSPKDKEDLALLYDSDGYQALKKLNKLEQIGLGADALMATTMEDVKYLKGRSYQWKVIIQIIRDIYKQVNKES